MSHTPFIVGAYLAALVGFGGLLVASLVARARVKRALGMRGLDRR